MVAPLTETGAFAHSRRLWLLILALSLFMSLCVGAIQANLTAILTQDVDDKLGGGFPAKPILVFQVGNGLHNQLMSFIDGMVVAILYQDSYDVALPPLWGSAFFKENTSQPMEFGDVYDANHFVECLSEVPRITLKVHKKLPKNYMVDKILYDPPHDSRKVNSDANWNSTKSALRDFARPGRAVDLGRWYAKFEYRSWDAAYFESRRDVLKCLAPAPKIKRLVDEASKKMRERYPMGVTAIHMRVEEDWRQYCARRPDMKDCLVTEGEWTERLKERKVSRPLLVFGGGAFDRTIFAKGGLDVITKDDLLKDHDLKSEFQYVSPLGALDFFLALEADRLVGFMFSSMDVLLYETRLYKCKSVDAIHSSKFGERWLQKVSQWTTSYFFYSLQDATCHFQSSSSCDVDKVLLNGCSRQAEMLLD